MMQTMSPLTPCLTIDGAAKAIDFYKAAFGAEEVRRSLADDGVRILMAQLKINGGDLLIWDVFPEMGAKKMSPAGVTIHIEVQDADPLWAQATSAGATIVMPLADQFWGARYGQIDDPFGQRWSIGTPSRADA